jgi:hypothetical protein
MPNCAQGFRARLAMKEGTGNQDFATGATGFPFFRESIKKLATIHHPDLITGTREEISERARYGPNVYGGWLLLALTPGHMATVYPWLLGADAVGTTYALAETLQTFSVLIDKVTGRHEFHDGVINRAIVHGVQHGPGGRPNWITVALQMLFQGYTGPASADAYPSLSLPVTGQYVPMTFEDGALTLAALARETKEFTLDINNYVVQRYVNNLNPTTSCPHHRTVKLKTVHPYDDDTDDLYGQALAGAAGSLVVTNGSVSITHTFGTLQVPDDTPEVPGKVEIDLELNMDARRVGSTPSLSVTIDDTP